MVLHRAGEISTIVVIAETVCIVANNGVLTQPGTEAPLVDSMSLQPASFLTMLAIEVASV